MSLSEEQEAAQELRDRLRDLANIVGVDSLPRTPSKAHLIGWGKADRPDPLEAGAFLSAVVAMNGNDPEARQSAKALLEALGSAWREPQGKATLGLTDATGGWVIPNAIVENIVKPAPTIGGLVDLVSHRPGFGGVASIDIPWRSSQPTAAAVIAWGDLKTNLDLTYNGYTATLYTLAQIYDLSKQLVRKSAGAAERDVMGELQEGFRRGESAYLWTGTGTSQPLGLVTAFTGAPATFTSTFSAAATLAGSVITAIGTALGALAARGRVRGLTAIVSPTSYVNLLTQGADAAGFYISGTQGASTIPGFQAGTPVVFGVPVVADPLCPTDDLYVGDFSEIVVYQGDGFRIESSDQAGTRWDYNLIGFRGEGEIGFDCRPAVYSGAIQAVADIIP